MDGILYVDLFFLWNFWMNALVLFLVRQITKTYRTVWCLLAALIGALFSCFGMTAYWISTNKEWLIVAESLSVLLMNGIAFGKKNLLWHSLLFFITGAGVAGIFLSVTTRITTFCKETTVAVVIVAGTAGIFCFLLEKNSRIHWKEEQIKAKTILEFAGKKLAVTALMDTGNRLYDPIFHQPVILVNEAILKEFLEYCRQNAPERLHYIPFHSVGKEQGMLEGITLDAVSVQWQEKRKKLHGVIAAATKESLYRGKEYQVIFHCGLFEEKEKKEGML